MTILIASLQFLQRLISLETLSPLLIHDLSLRGFGIGAASFFFVGRFLERGLKKDTAESPVVDHQSNLDDSPKEFEMSVKKD